MGLVQDMTTNRYSMSFTSGALLRQESLTVATIYQEWGDWKAVRDRVVAGNLLQMRTINASKRIFSEVSSRLKQLSADELDLFLNGSEQESVYLLWLAFCRRYRFIYDFAAEVVREKFLRFDFALTYEDYDIFFNKKAEWHPEMERVAPVTISKQKQFVFRIMREAGLLSAGNQIIPAMLTPGLITVIVQVNPADLTVFPVSDLDIKNWTI